MRFSYLMLMWIFNIQELFAKDVSDQSGMLEYVQELTGKIDTLEKKLEEFERRLQSHEDQLHKKDIAGKEQVKTLPSTEAVLKNKPARMPPSGGSEHLWKEALCVLQQKKFAEAKQKFIDFLRFYPDHSNASEGQYWLGEIEVAAQNYSEAQVFYALAYKGFLEGSPRKTEVGVKLADCYFALNKNKEGCVFLKEVMQLQQKGAAITPATLRLLEQLWIKYKCPDNL